MFLSFVEYVVLSMFIRFNATALLERLRNKRLVFVGDSLNRGQWVSMVCLVDSSLSSTLTSMHTTANGSLNVWKVKVSFHHVTRIGVEMYNKLFLVLFYVL